MLLQTMDLVQLGKDFALFSAGIGLAIHHGTNIYARVKNGRNGERRENGTGQCRADHAVAPLLDAIERFERATERLSEQIAASNERFREEDSRRHTDVMTSLATIRAGLRGSP
jgi:hypothetical protein